MRKEPISHTNKKLLIVLNVSLVAMTDGLILHVKFMLLLLVVVLVWPALVTSVLAIGKVQYKTTKENEHQYLLLCNKLDCIWAVPVVLVAVLVVS